MKMNVLLLGSGGREHALAWKIAQSPLCGKLFIAPGNPGTANCGENIALDILDFDAQKLFCLNHDIHLVMVGPEVPLVEGVVDHFKADPKTAAIPVIGPTKNAAQLEGSKAFAKEFMVRHQIPTAGYQEFKQQELQSAIEYLKNVRLPIVLKADGLAAGKGVVICQSLAEAENELREMLGGKFGEAGSKVVIEDFLSGREMSVFALSDGRDYVILPTAKDYKRIGESDTGLNTGGMGAVCPVPFASEELMRKIEKLVIRPTIDGLLRDQLVYQGFIYFGLMIVDGEPLVIEYNCRLGDPETQAVLPMIKSDLLALLAKVHDGGLHNSEMEIEMGMATTVILASGGYPESYEKNKTIEGINDSGDSLIFHAGTVMDNMGKLLTSGGRVLAVTGRGENMTEALSHAYSAAEAIHFEGKYYRKDIGFDVI
jgi:phosphoribosylamine---glycine ligase